MITVSAPFKLTRIVRDSPVPFAIKSVPRELIVRLEPGVVHAGEWFTLRSTDGSIQRHDQFSTDELVFRGLDPALSYTLIADGKPLFEDVPYTKLAGLQGAPQPKHDAGTGDFHLRMEGDVSGTCVLTGESGFQEEQPAAETVTFTAIPRDETLSLSIDGHPIFAGVPYTELAHASGDHAEPELREHEMIDEHPTGLRSES